jgi:O-antigen ligase
MSSTLSAPSRSYLSVQRFALRCILISFATAFVVAIEPAPTDLLFAIGFLILVLTIGLRFEITPETRTFHALLVGFIVFNILSLVIANSFSFGVMYFLITLYLALIPLVMTHFASVFGARAVDALYAAFVLGTICGGVVGVAALAGVAPGPVDLYFRSDEGLRLSPLFKDPNVYGPYMVAGGFLLMARALVARARARVFMIGFSLFVLALMVLTFSRGAWINAAVVVLVFMTLIAVCTRSVRDMKWLLALLVISGGAIVVGLPFMLDALGLDDFFAQRAQLQYYDTERFSNWVTAYTISLREPLGIGPGHFVRRADFPQSEFDLDPHNIFLKVMVENGWLGFVTFFGAIGAVMVGLLRSFSVNDPRRVLRLMVFAILTGQIVNGLVVDLLHWRHFFVILGFACCELVLVHAGLRRAAAPS